MEKGAIDLGELSAAEQELYNTVMQWTPDKGPIEEMPAIKAFIALNPAMNTPMVEILKLQLSKKD